MGNEEDKQISSGRPMEADRNGYWNRGFVTIATLLAILLGLLLGVGSFTSAMIAIYPTIPSGNG